VVENFASDTLMKYEIRLL